MDADEVHLWFWLPERACETASLHEFEALLAADELSHYEHLRFPQHQREYLVSHAMVRKTLSQYRECEPQAWQFRRNPFGKPALADGDPLRFNLSHTHGLALCAICHDGEIGVDVEFHANSQSLLDLADHYFSEREVADLNALPEAQRGAAFFRYWTLKEAFVKARGEGLSMPLDSFSFSIQPGGEIGLDTGSASDDARWWFRSLQPHPAYTAAVALHRPERGEPRLRLFTADLHGWRELDDAGELAELLPEETH
jgi:4'-phosphopantetheinyl transferase